MITGAARMDGGILVVSAVDGAMPDPMTSACANAGVIAVLASARAKRLRNIQGLSFP